MSRRGAAKQLSPGPYLVAGRRRSDAVLCRAQSRGGEVPPSRPKNTANCQNGIKREKKVNINSITSMEEHGCKSFSEIGRCPSKQITLRDGEFRLAPLPPSTPPKERLPEADLSWRLSLAFSLYTASLASPASFYDLPSGDNIVTGHFLYEPLPRFKKDFGLVY